MMCGYKIFRVPSPPPATRAPAHPPCSLPLQSAMVPFAHSSSLVAAVLVANGSLDVAAFAGRSMPRRASGFVSTRLPPPTTCLGECHQRRTRIRE
ncbi:hypothetical protein ACHAWF_007869 [Thalassiosira exigua]